MKEGKLSLAKKKTKCLDFCTCIRVKTILVEKEEPVNRQEAKE